MKSEFDASAQFGGRDAAQAALPHFRAIKAAARTARLRSFPFRRLAFVLRVDGEVNEYGLHGVGKVEIDVKGEYVSIDVGCTLDDRTQLEATISNAILAAPELLQAHRDDRLATVNFEALAEDLAGFVACYRESLAAS